MTEMGRVVLVGAGPGDPDLMTVKAVRSLSQADVVVYDRLVSAEILALIPPGTMRIGVGKAPRNHTIPQDEINELLVRLACAGRIVVRLKGGDPFIFGRGSEEAAHLVRHAVPFEVIPGITSAQGCSASTLLPLTHRGVATSVRYITGHCREDAELDFDWRGLADPDTTLVIYMGMANIGRFAGELVAHGLSPATPAAAINNGTTPQQKHITTRLDTIARESHEAGFEGPVLFIIGEVVTVGEQQLKQERSDGMEKDMAHLG